jgi:hypothetical protein
MTTYDLYCDESGIDTGPTFHFGALRCTPARARILEAELALIRGKYGLTAEMKWTRVSNAMLQAYKAFVDVFLDCPFANARFHLFTVTRGAYWRAFGRDEDERFFKSYYVFLRLTMSLECRYNVYADDKPGKRYRWSNVAYSISRANRRDHGLRKEQVRCLVPRNSKQYNLLQVSDIVLGALVSTPTAPAKQELARYIQKKLPGHSGKLVRRSWSPVLRAKFRA